MQTIREMLHAEESRFMKMGEIRTLVSHQHSLVVRFKREFLGAHAHASGQFARALAKQKKGGFAGEISMFMRNP